MATVTAKSTRTRTAAAAAEESFPQVPTTQSPIELIGDAAGIVWRALDQSGAVSMTKLLKDIEAPRDLVLQAIGWLAREGKIEIVDSSKGKTIALR